jgi:hypothetical protein
MTRGGLDPMDLVALTAFLAPLLPFLVKGGEEAVKEIGTKFGSEIWERAQVLWATLRPKVESKPAALEVVQDVAKDPANELAKAALRYQVEKLLSEDAQFAQEVARLWEEIAGTGKVSQVIASGERAVAIGRNAIGTTLTTGDQNVVEPSG